MVSPRSSRGLVGLVILGFAALAAAQAPPAVDTAGWTTLRDPALGFQLRHPPTWRVGRTTGTMESVTLSEPQAGTVRLSMQVLVQRDINPRGLSIEDWYADQLKRLKVATPPPSSRTTLGGRPTIRREMSRPGGRQFDFYTVVGPSDVFQVSISRPEGPLDPIHETILSTITFLP
jgi:hypothetical protein